MNPRNFRSTVFKTAALNHSAIPPAILHSGTRTANNFTIIYKTDYLSSNFSEIPGLSSQTSRLIITYCFDPSKRRLFTDKSIVVMYNS